MNYQQRQTAVSDDTSKKSAITERNNRVKLWIQFLTISDCSSTPGKSYNDQIMETDRSKRYAIVLNIDDVARFESAGQHLVTELRDNPQLSLTLISEACKCILLNQEYESDEFKTLQKSLPDFQVIVDPGELNHLVLKNLIDLTSDSIRKLVRITGIVVNLSKIKCKAEIYSLKCKSCGNKTTLPSSSVSGGIKLPQRCFSSSAAKDCGAKPYVIIPDECICTDYQTLTLQQDQRTFSATLSRYLCGAVSPGSSVEITAIYSPIPSKTQSTGVFLQILGIKTLTEQNELERMSKAYDTSTYTQFANDPDLQEKIVGMMCPMIRGHDNIKLAMAAMLFGGTRKSLDNGIYLRGDLNLLIIGDPGLGKSQLLKFASKVSPRGVFTSGKGASAAGLTAAVIRDPVTGEFVLEGGALVLADGGICAVDEFDKMREQDRVALHEAMEQQTISVSKAGITTVFTTRTSVFAASNPVSGSFDDLKSISEQVDFQTTILSRFDLIFALRDNSTAEDDRNLAAHILSAHQDLTTDTTAQDESFNFISAYIAYAKSVCHPRLHPDAIEDLRDWYSKTRKTAAEKDSMKIKITVRQLEAVIRLSEAFARMSLSREATIDHVNRAKELFQNATMQAIEQKQTVPSDAWTMNQINVCISEIKKKMPLHAKFNQRKLKKELIDEKFADYVVNAAIVQMIARKELKASGNNTLARVQ